MDQCSQKWTRASPEWVQIGVLPELTLRSDNGSQPCTKRITEYSGKLGIQGQYTGYNAPDDNAFVERVIRTLKKEEIWMNQYDSFEEAHEAVDSFIRFFNRERIHASLNYHTPVEFAETRLTIDAA
ncbi:MAG: transposase [Candidatus Hodarchaeales archaeon]